MLAILLEPLRGWSQPENCSISIAGASATGSVDRPSQSGWGGTLMPLVLRHIQTAADTGFGNSSAATAPAVGAEEEAGRRKP